MPAPRFPRILSVLCYAVRDGRVLMMHRRKQPNLRLWTAPGGKLEWDEAPHETVVREMREETGLSPPPLELLEVREHSYPDRTLRLHFHLGDLTREESPLFGGWRWVEIAELDDGRIPAANRGIPRIAGSRRP